MSKLLFHLPPLFYTSAMIVRSKSHPPVLLCATYFPGHTTKAWKCNFGEDFGEDFGDDFGDDLGNHL